ncbi:threonine synthase [Spirochaetia bacterium]|nr:threonine synthase [Spirochaetia bacterium]
MYFRSTVNLSADLQTGLAGDSGAVSFKEAVLRCLPKEGGLYVPDSVPDLRPFFLHMGEETAYPELAAAVTPLLFEGDLNPLSASRVAENAFTFEPELVQLDETFSLLNLYNGPTGVFKDFGISFLAALLEELLQGETAMVIAAARGNTGVAIARAFEHREGIITTLLYPDEPIYGLESSSYVPQGGNVIPIRVKGTLDDCQKLVREVIQDRSFAERYRITGANAINPGRLLPQSFYFLYSFIKLKKHLTGELVFSIPSGNFGNLIAGLYAWKFGMPVNGYIAAMNANNYISNIKERYNYNSLGEVIKNGILADFKGGTFAHGFAGSKPAVSTIAPALDVGHPSNYERLASFYKSAPAVMQNMVFPEGIDDAGALKAMETAWKRYGIHLDPHGAVAFAAAENAAAYKDFNGHIVVLATGHPAKYADLAFKVSGKRLSLPEQLASLDRRAEPIAEIAPDLEGLESAIAGCF